MAALRRTSKLITSHISQSNSSILSSSASSSLPSAALFISRRGIAFKLFVGGSVHRPSTRAIYLLSSHLNSSPPDCKFFSNRLERRGSDQRYSTASKRSRKPRHGVDLLSYIESTLDELEGELVLLVEGPSHCWFNRAEYKKNSFKKNGGFLVLVGEFVGDSLTSSCDPVGMIEKVKSLQQRYPSLQVMGFQYSHSVCSSAVCTHLLQKIMEEYITFPVLLSNKNFTEMKDGACYFVFKDFQSPLIYHEKDVNLVILDKAVKDLNVQDNNNSRLEEKLKSSWMNPIEIVKEPYLSSSLRNLLFHFPGCISVDESGNRFFLSDANHHRIIVFDINGKTLDSIGSSPGFEDGEFECAKLLRPAASFYDDAEDCVYFVDSENHSIRRADMERRVVDTIYPNTSKKDNSLWGWILDKLRMRKEVDTKPKEFNSESFLFPWHLIKSSDNDLYVLNRSLEALWIVDLASGLIKELVIGPKKIFEICGPKILEKSLLFKQFPTDWLQQQVDSTSSLEEIPYAGLISSVATFGNHLIICDTVGQMVFKVNRTSGMISSFQFSNFGILGLPYWMSFPLERVYASVDALSRSCIDHVESFCLLPGKVDIQLNVDIPQDTDLVEPLQECCIWRQARGAAIEVSGAERRAESSEKVGVAQQWYDEIDNLAFSAQEIESRTEEESRARSEEVPEKRICIGCSVCTSPGTSEVIISAVLYLKLKCNPDSKVDGQENKLARLAELLDPIRSGRRDSIVDFLSKSNKDAEEFIFMRPLHVRLKFECGDHPKADNTKSIILTDSSFAVNVSLH